MSNLKDLEKNIGYKFKNITFLKIALTHKSYLDEYPDLQSNQRYEFFGDAILDFDLTEYLFENYPELDEGSLTKIRSSAVRAGFGGAGRRRGRRASRRAPGARGRGFISRRAASRGRRGAGGGGVFFSVRCASHRRRTERGVRGLGERGGRGVRRRGVAHAQRRRAGGGARAGEYRVGGVLERDARGKGNWREEMGRRRSVAVTVL